MDAEFADLEAELGLVDNVFGARQLADRLAVSFPSSGAALRLQGFAAMRADDPAAAVRSFSAALALTGAWEREREHREASRAHARIVACANSWRAIPQSPSRNRKRSPRATRRPRTGSTTRYCYWRRNGTKRQSRSWSPSRSNPTRRRSLCGSWV